MNATAKKRAKLEATAYHEAGHAVIAFALRKRASHVTIEANEQSLGCVSFLPIKSSDNWEFEPEKHRRLVEREILVALAGAEAAYIFSGRRDGTGAIQIEISKGRKARYLLADGDMRAAQNAAEVLAYDYVEASALVRWLQCRVNNMLSKPYTWAAVEALAQELLTRKTAPWRDARKIIRQAMIDSVPPVDMSQFNMKVISESAAPTTTSSGRTLAAKPQ